MKIEKDLKNLVLRYVKLVFSIGMMRVIFTSTIILASTYFISHAQSPKRTKDRTKHMPKIIRENIPYFIDIKDENNEKKRKTILHFDPDANLIKYPLFEYKANLERIAPIKFNSKVPEEIWDLPIRIVNDKKGRDSITLRELSKDKILVLDFWATWCAPCLASMDKWKNLQPKYSEQVQVVGLMLDYDYKAELMIKKKGWAIPQLVGPEAYFLNAFFCGTPIVGPSAWINEGKFIGVSETKVNSEKLLNSLLNGEITIIPDDGFKLEVSKIK